MSPDFHRHGLFHPRRSAVSQLAKAPSVVGRIRKEALQPAHRIRTGRPSALPKPHHCCGRFYYFFRRPLFKTLPPVFPLPRGRGEGQDGDKVGIGWGCGISLYPNAERTPCFSATPSIGTQNATAVSNQPPRPHSAALLSPRSPQRSPSGYCLCPAHTATIILQAILHNHHPTQQKYNFVPFKSQK